MTKQDLVKANERDAAKVIAKALTVKRPKATKFYRTQQSELVKFLFISIISECKNKKYDAKPNTLQHVDASQIRAFESTVLSEGVTFELTVTSAGELCIIPLFEGKP